MEIYSNNSWDASDKGGMSQSADTTIVYGCAQSVKQTQDAHKGSIERLLGDIAPTKCMQKTTHDYSNIFGMSSCRSILMRRQC